MVYNTMVVKPLVCQEGIGKGNDENGWFVFECSCLFLLLLVLLLGQGGHVF